MSRAEGEAEVDGRRKTKDECGRKLFDGRVGFKVAEEAVDDP